MRAAKKINVDKRLLKELVPLNALSEERFRAVSEKIIIEEVLAGRYLFRKGDRDNQSIYLLEGKINLIDGVRKVTSEIKAGSDVSRHAISNQQPRPLSARAVNKSIIARVDSGLLDVLLTWDQSSSAEVVEIGSDDNQDWMTRILQSEAFIKIPPAMIQSLLIKMQSYPVKAGDVVIRQGEAGDYFYTIHEGRCAVTRRESPDADDQWLAELGDGASFGEDALVSDVKRNATITMLTDGLLMRLAKEDFIGLLKEQLVKRVDYEQGAAMVDEGAVWVDVRTADEYESGSFEDSVNMPLADLRDEISELVFNTKYIICCDTGRRSESAGFLLSHKGFDVYVLEGGIPAPPVEETPADAPVTGEFAADVAAAESGSQGVVEEKVTDEDGAKRDEALVALRSENEKLLAEIQEYEAAGVRASEQLEQLRGELGESGAKLSALYAQANTDAEQLELLRGELGESGEKLGALYAQTDTDTSEIQLLQQEVQQLKDALKEANGRVTVLESEPDASGQALQEELKEQAEQSKRQQQELETALAAAKDQQQTLEQQVKDLQSSHEKQLQELSAVSEEKEHADGTLQSLQQENGKLQTELRETALKLDEQRENAGNQLTGKEAAEEALQRQQSEWESERAALLQSTEDERRVTEELRRELESAATEREQLQQTLDSADGEKSSLESEAELLKEQAIALAESSAEELQLLQEQLKAEQARAAGLEQSGGDKDVQIRDLQEEILQSSEMRGSLEQEVESSRKQHDDMQLQLEQQAVRTKELEQEHEDSIRKAHEDLTRKNFNEKELQGQIARLRKKLEQSTADLKNSRDGSQTDIDNIREELHAEREARAEERAEMAARQRELKEQFSVIAVEHEANLTNHTGAIEQARDAGREEEQERLRQLLEAQNQSEELVLALQQELQKAHEEVADLTRQEKDRRQVDMEMMQEQNQQAVSTITQLESQLQQLTLDRDTALDEQQGLREKMNTLRGEVEVARDLMNESSQGHVEDTGKLRRELDESKKNMEIALRLQAEAEAARDKLIEERDALQEKRDEEAEAARDKLIEERNALQEKRDEEVAAGTTLHVPSLDEVKTGSDHPQPQPVVTAISLVKEKSVVREKANKLPPLVPVDKDARRRRWLGATISLGVVGAVVLAVWLLPGAVNLVSIYEEFRDIIVAEVDSGVADEAVVAIKEDAHSAEKPVTPPVEVREPVAVVVPPEPVAAVPVTKSPQEKAGSEPSPVRMKAIRTFRDSLKGGSKGPVMVELPANGYLMGSPGESLNYDEGPRHEVTVPGFSISQHEVRFAEYDKFARATGRRLPKDESWGRGDRPVINVSWADARAYAKWLSKKTGKKYRLPTEAEWEYAARAGNTAKVWWDSDVDVKQANCFNCGSKWDGKRTAPTGSFRENGFGLYDMAGNVQEWTEDCYHPNYSKAPDDGGAWLTPGCTRRVVRGGGYTSPLDSLRYARRGQHNQDTRLDNIGFRVVRSN